MKCADCMFKKDSINLKVIGIIYTCGLIGVTPKPDCKYYRQKKEAKEK